MHARVFYAVRVMERSIFFDYHKLPTRKQALDSALLSKLCAWKKNQDTVRKSNRAESVTYTGVAAIQRLAREERGTGKHTDQNRGDPSHCSKW